jgi:signal transduction histidine kinase
LQYTPEGGKIKISAKQSKDEIQISIHDTGVGIPPEHLTHIFDRFYRVDKSRSRQAGGGSGIGLTMARALVEAHGGRIWAESNGEGKGSIFTLPPSPEQQILWRAVPFGWGLSLISVRDLRRQSPPHLRRRCCHQARFLRR